MSPTVEDLIITPTELPTPTSSSRSADLVGTDVILADGHQWTLADFVPRFDPVWDRIYDQNLLASHYRLDDVLLASSRLLLAHYDLGPEVAVWLIQGADPTRLVRAIEAALFGRRDELRTWSDWAKGALWSNGIDPAILPAPELRRVLDQLVTTKRAMSHCDFTSAGIAALKRQDLLARFEQAGIKPSSPVASQPIAPADSGRPSGPADVATPEAGGG